MVVTKIRLYKDSSGAILGEFLNGLNGVSQNNANANEVLVVVDGFELQPNEVLRIGYDLSSGEESISYSLMKDNHDGTYKADLPYAVTNIDTNQGALYWIVGLQIASNWIENESFKGYLNKQNLANTLTLSVTNSIRDKNGVYPTLGDLSALYMEAQQKVVAETKNAEEIATFKEEVADYKNHTNTAIDVLLAKDVEIEQKINANTNAITMTNDALSTHTIHANATFGTDITAEMSQTDYKLALRLKNANGEYIGNGVVIDLPLEELVVSGTLDDDTNEIVLTLKSGQEIRIKVGELVRGLVTDASKGQPYGVASLDADGKVPKGQLPEGIVGEEALKDYVKFTDYVTASKAGAVKVNQVYGIAAGVSGTLYIRSAYVADIDKKESEYLPITTKFQDYAWKKSATTNTEEWTDEEKASACETIGAVKAITQKSGLPWVYIKNADGTQNTLNIVSEWDDASSGIPKYFMDSDENGNLVYMQLSVNPIPTRRDSATSKEYVDEAVANAGGKLYVHTVEGTCGASSYNPDVNKFKLCFLSRYADTPTELTAFGDFINAKCNEYIDVMDVEIAGANAVRLQKPNASGHLYYVGEENAVMFPILKVYSDRIEYILDTTAITDSVFIESITKHDIREV